MKGIFITSTDTGVGKTFFASGLLRTLKNKNLNVCGFKPFVSGSKEDAILLKKASKSNENLNLINPVFFKKPLAPYVASKIEKKDINLKRVFEAFEALKKKYELLIVEGIGGVLVPIKKNYFVLNLIKDLKLPVIVMVKPSLGTINQTLLTLKILRDNKIKILGMVINGIRNLDMAERTNPDVLKKLGRCPILAKIPHNKRLKNVERLSIYLKSQKELMRMLKCLI
ncbi:MAG: dethiobiotin synthase [Candidatus Firestonebacteria bacterium]